MRHIALAAVVSAALTALVVVGYAGCGPGSCPPNQVVCGSACTNTNTDPANCGQCGTACTDGKVCSTGICKCPTGSSSCARPDGGYVGCGSGSFAVSTLDGNARGRFPIATATAPNGTIGVAYFTQVAPKPSSCMPDGGASTGRADYEIKYVEPGKAPELVDTVQLPAFGLSLAFDGQNMPLIAYLGGRSNAGTYWCQSDLSVAYRQSGAWLKENVVDTGAEVTCPGTNQPLSDRGDVVGLWASVSFDRNKNAFVIAYRDVHDGQFPVQDWGSSDMEMLEGRPGAWTRSCCVSPSTGASGTNTGAGGMNNVVVNDGEPAVVYANMPGSAGENPKGVLFARRNAAGCSTPFEIESSIDTRTGPRAAWDPFGKRFGVVYEQVPSILYFRASDDGATWERDQVFGAGTGGWYPSIAFIPSTGQPVVAYFVCSASRAGLSEPCPPADQELRVSIYCDPNWKHLRADNVGVYLTAMGVDGQGNPFVVYRDSAANREAIKLARFSPQ